MHQRQCKTFKRHNLSLLCAYLINEISHLIGTLALRFNLFQNKVIAEVLSTHILNKDDSIVRILVDKLVEQRKYKTTGEEDKSTNNM